MNLSSNGVPDDVFTNLMDDCVRDIFKSFTAWDERDAGDMLFSYIYNTEGVLSHRVRELDAARARAAGYDNRHNISNYVAQIDDVHLIGDEVPDAEDLRYWFSGLSSSLSESSLQMLAAGFNPKDNETLRDKIKNLLTSRINNAIEKKYSILVPLSACGFVVPGMFIGSLRSWHLLITQPFQTILELSKAVKSFCSHQIPVFVTGEFFLDQSWYIFCRISLYPEYSPRRHRSLAILVR